jgi:hypothetical protein
MPQTKPSVGHSPVHLENAGYSVHTPFPYLQTQPQQKKQSTLRKHLNLPSTCLTTTPTRAPALIAKYVNKQPSNHLSENANHHLTLTRGNHYCARDYGSSATNPNSYHYSNSLVSGSTGIRAELTCTMCIVTVLTITATRTEAHTATVETIMPSTLHLTIIMATAVKRIKTLLL